MTRTVILCVLAFLSLITGAIPLAIVFGGLAYWLRPKNTPSELDSTGHGPSEVHTIEAPTRPAEIAAQTNLLNFDQSANGERYEGDTKITLQERFEVQRAWAADETTPPLDGRTGEQMRLEFNPDALSADSSLALSPRERRRLASNPPHERNAALAEAPQLDTELAPDTALAELARLLARS